MEQCLVLFISARLFTITIVITTITIVIVIITLTIIITSARCSSSPLFLRRETFLGPTLVQALMASTKALIKELAKAPTKAPTKAPSKAPTKAPTKAPSKGLTRALIKTSAQGRTLPVGSLALSTMEGVCQIPWFPRWLKFTLLHTAGIGYKKMTKLI